MLAKRRLELSRQHLYIIETSMYTTRYPRFKQALRNTLLHHCFVIYEVGSILLGDTPDRAHFLVVKQNPIEFVSPLQHFRPECRRDKLRRLGKFVYHC